MKQIKHFVLVLMAIVLVFAVPFSTACKTDTPPPEPIKPEVTETLKELSVDASKVKSVYYVGEEFTSAGLVVTAIVKKSNSDTPETRDVTSSATVDSSAFVSDKSGDYTINVSYTLGEVTKSGSFSVTVTDKDGLDVKLADGVADTITLTAENTVAAIDLTKIVVRTVNYKGEVIGTNDGLLSASEYTTKLFVKDTEITEGFDNLGEGAYQIWAYSESKLISGYQLSGFALIYVVDEIVKLEKTAGDTEQIVGADTISADWTFTATYASGKTINLTAQEVKNDIDTKTQGENKTATVAYSYKNAKGENKSVELEVSYTIKPKPVQEGDITYTMSYKVNSTPDGWETTWSENEDTDGNVNITSTVSSFKAKEKSTVGDNPVKFTNFGEVKGYSEKSITISVNAKAKDVSVKVYASHTTSAEARNIYLASATTIDDSTKILNQAKIGGEGNLSTSNVHEISATGLASGNYYVYGDAGKGIHIYAVVVEYTIEASESKETVTSINFSDTAKISANAQLASDSATGLVAIQDTGFSVTKCGSSGKYTLIGAQNKVQCLQFQGAGALDKNSIAVTVGAGEVTVEMKYFQGNAGRYLKVLNEGLDTTAATETELTTSDKAIKTRTVTFTLTAETVIYLGSAASGLYVTEIIITVVGK